MTNSDLKIDFNDQQLDVFEAVRTTNDSLVIEALPGTGKTLVLVECLRFIYTRVFVCAFGAEARAQLVERARRVVGDSVTQSHPSVKISTTHSLGMSTWMRSRGYDIKVDRNKVRVLLNGMIGTQPLAAKFSMFMVRLIGLAKRTGLGVLGSIENVKNWLAIVEEYGLRDELQGEEELLPAIIACCIEVYFASLKQCSRVIDFDDQILAPLYYEARFAKWPVVMIDEAQDTSPLRLHMLMNCVADGGRVIAVGDRNQAIMGFTGTSIDSMTEIIDMTGASVLPLSVTYRVPKSGVALAQAIVPEFRAAESNCEGTIEEIDLGVAGVAPTTTKNFWGCGPFTADDVILCRTTKPLVELAYQMIREGIACKVEGKDIGLGLKRLLGRWHVSRLLDLEAQVTAYKRYEVSRLTAKMEDEKAESVGDQCDTLRALIDMTFDRGGDSVAALHITIDSVFGDTPEGKPPSLCTLSTVHKAKGREWPRVFILGLRQYMPSKHAKNQRQLREERNLILIAETRHKESLVIVNVPDDKPKRRDKHHGRQEDNGRQETNDAR